MRIIKEYDPDCTQKLGLRVTSLSQPENLVEICSFLSYHTHTEKERKKESERERGGIHRCMSQ